MTAVDARLKWPNDLLQSGSKLGGILCEAAGDAVVIGIGINVSAAPGDLPSPAPGSATSLRAAGAASVDPCRLLAGILAELERWYAGWRQTEGDAERCGLRGAYTRLCDTIGRQVRVELPGGQLLSGLAAGVDPGGRLLVRVPPAAEIPVSAGDVVHLR
ncbi:MAG: biotin--[acetyl-CoA-carboxylase] ligase [Streptosporangiaceae bacterium]|nr:biotin--[acetyl-CoA-carboxylase] ligase [Streptosporangiaceae bacterium]